MNFLPKLMINIWQQQQHQNHFIVVTLIGVVDGGHLVVIFSSKLRCITSLSRFLVHSEPIFGNWTPQKDPFRLPKLTSIIQKTFVCKSLKNKRNRVHVKVISIATSFFLLYVLLIVILSFFLINCHFFGSN